MKYNDFSDESIIQFHVAPKENAAVALTHELEKSRNRRGSPVVSGVYRHVH